MPTLKISLLLLIGLSLVSLRQAGLLPSPQKYYDEIDSYLSTALATDDAEKNMQKAAEWLAELEKKGCFPLVSNPLVKSLKQFLQLQTVVGEDKCNQETYKILAKFDRPEHHFKDFIEESYYKRIYKVARYYSQKHYEACKSVWPQKLADKMEQVSPESMNYVLKFAETSSIPWEYKKLGMKWIDLLRSYNKADPEHKKAVANKKYFYQTRIVTLDNYRKYIVDPCKEVRKTVNDELYKPIKFDIDVQSRGLDFVGNLNQEFRKNRVIMDWCDYIHTNEGPIWDKIYKIMADEKECEKRRKVT